MDRFAAMIILLASLVSILFILFSFFFVAPIFCTCLLVLMYSLYWFMAYEESGIHQAQEFENRFWTIFAVMFSLVLFFVQDSPLAFGRWFPALGLVSVALIGYAMHVWDRYMHRMEMSSQPASRILRRSLNNGSNVMLSQSLLHLRDLGIPVEAQLKKINDCLKEIDQLLIPSTINNYINRRYVQSKEREIIAVFEECDARALNFLIGHVKLGLLFYKVKDHPNFHGKHRTTLINLLAVERLPIVSVMGRVVLLHSLQLLKIRANPRAEFWVRNIILNTHQDDLSELKTLTDAKGDYFCMNKLIYDDIRSESVRQDILHHIRKEAAVQQTYWQMGSKRRNRRFNRPVMTWRKVLSDVDDTLTCSAGMYPAGVDKRYPKRTVYPGVLAFYRELDLGTQGPEEWADDRVGNLVFLSARPHVYKDMSEKHNFAKFEKLQMKGEDGRTGMHTTPSLLAGDLASGSQFFVTNDFEPLARKKFDNFRRYVGIYPEYQHVFVCDNGQGDVRAGEMMFDSFPYEFEALYVHTVQPVHKTHGFNLERWRSKEFSPVFFRTYPEAALHAASRHPPLIRMEGLRRICQDTVKDFAQIKSWPSEQVKAERRLELNQAICQANEYLSASGEARVEMILADQMWENGARVCTPYGAGTIIGFDPRFDLYELALDWRPLDVQLCEFEETSKSTASQRATVAPRQSLATVPEQDESEEIPSSSRSGRSSPKTTQECGESSAEKPSHTREQVGVTADVVVASPRPTQYHGCNRAFITGKLVTKHTAPILPKMDKRSSVFSFFNVPEASVKRQSLKRAVLEKGTECSTPYGPVTVVEHRTDTHVVVVKMIGWQALGYIHEASLAPLPRNLLTTLLRQFSSDSAPRIVEFPHATGTKVRTPFGEGSVQRPILAGVRKNQPTLGISLDSWHLADGTHPMLYCTEETARAWKDQEGEGLSIFFNIGSAIVTSSRSLLEPFLQQPKTPVREVAPKLWERYYADGAAVSTMFGYGRVVCFRDDTDGVYEIELSRWKLDDGSHPRVYSRAADVRTWIAEGCQEGYPVLTSFKLTGVLASVEAATGVHIVTIPSAGLVCYLQPDCVVKPIKAAVGEEVMTQFGNGKVEKYNEEMDHYSIRLLWGAQLHATADTFDRGGDGIQDKDGPFGVNWLLRLLFFSPGSIGKSDSLAQSTGRSRSNSVVSQKSIS